MTHAILALDLGTKNCWAFRASDHHVVSSTQSFKPQRFDSGGMRLPHAAIAQECAA
jgi:hypothetical protein